MNKTKSTFVGLLVWIIISVIYSEFKSAADGYDHLGFPFVFYTAFAGKTNSDIVLYGSAFNINIINLILDLFFAVLFIVLLNLILPRLFKPTKTNPNL